MNKNYEDEIKKKLEYIGLDLKNVPETLKTLEPINFRPTKGYEENRYKQYRFVPIKDIEILLTPTNRLDSIEEKCTKASSVYSYLMVDDDNEESIAKHTKFLEMLKSTKIEDIEKVEKEQKELNTKIPFKVKYPGNYLWQIYYSEATSKYFMLVPIGDSDYSAFFYLLKRQLEKRRIGKIFVPISYLDYSRGLFSKSDIEDIENYLWLFTKDWPNIYEVHDKTDKISFQIIGETEVYENIKTPYKITLNTKEEADQFYKLLKAIFILQTQLPHYYKFETKINENAELELYYEDKLITYYTIGEFINTEYVKIIKNEKEKKEEIQKLEQKLNLLREELKIAEAEYIVKEKQISIYLECKKTFFGKVKYLLKYSKKVKRKNINVEKEDYEEEKNSQIEEIEEYEEDINGRYNLEDLVEKAKRYQIKEDKFKKLVMDINALKLRIKNINKKIENATQYLEEIDRHKKSIFDFWKYANKDELSRLPEGEEETINVEPQIKRKFSYKDDMEKLGEYLDFHQSKDLTKEELDSIYVSTTNILNLINTLIATKETARREMEISLKKLKEEISNEENDDFNIFGGLVEDNRKVKTIANKTHREIERNLYNILEISKNTTITEYKFELDRVIKNLKNAMAKIKTDQDIVVYKATNEEELKENKINTFNLNIENEIQEILRNSEDNINLYKLEIEKGKNVIGFTNNVFYYNKNNTLPTGMDLSSKVLISDLEIEARIKKEASKVINIAYFEIEKDELSKVKVKTINIYE